MRPSYCLPLLPALASALGVRSTACNNSPSLCDKSYGEITHLGAHDSPFLRDSSTDDSLFGDQYYDTTTQLSAGVRLVTAQVHKSNSEWRLCHSSCDYLDAGLLKDWLKDIKTWLDDNPNEVVTILLVNSDDASASDLGTIYENANITSYAYEPDSLTSAPTTWPTLQEMINNGTRLVNFVASLTTSSDYPYLMSEWDFIWENQYDVTSASNFTCTPNRPTEYDNDLSSALSSNLLPFMNHFLYSSITISTYDIEYPNASYVSTTNAASGGTGNLGSTATKCKKDYNGRQPTFILVDFFNRGPAIDTVDSLNNVTNPVGRTSVSTSASTSDASTTNGVLTSLVDLAESARSGENVTFGNWIWAAGAWGTILGGGISL